ncbi:MAG TPA: C25 family cysteine peptidase, partial [Candidatus Eisenbacteria bacterium]|nr:C25 family cysteine peptidase [Candidatus Eisenbacteria bacterium]
MTLLVVASAAAPRVVRAEPEGVRLTATGPASLRFTVEVAAPRLSPVREGATIQRLEIDGFEGVAAPGHAVLPERVVTVAVPPTGEVRVSSSALEPETRDAVALSRAAVMPRGTEMTVSDAEILTETLAASGEPAGGAPVPMRPGARLLEVGWMRNQRVARIAVTPAEYDPKTGRLSIARRVDVDVSISAATAAPGSDRPAEAIDPFERLYQRTLVNYAQGRAWRRSAHPGPTSRFSLRDLAPAQVLGVATPPDTSVYAGRTWVKIAIPATGFYKVRFADLRNLALFGGSTTTLLDSLRLFTWPGFPVLPEESYCDTCDYREVALGFVETTPNGILDQNSEYFYFFAMGASDWASLYDTARPDTVFIDHPYETTNYCYLTIASAALPVGGTPRRIATESGAVSGATGGEVTPSTFQARLHHEVDAQYWPDPFPDPFPYKSGMFWEKWFWQTVEEARPPFIVNTSAPGVDTSQPSRFRMRAWGVSALVFRSFNIFDHYLDVGFNSVTFPRREWNERWAQTYDSTEVGLVKANNTLALQVPDITDPNPEYNVQRVDQTGLAWFDFFYARRFEPVSNELDFDSAPGGGSYIYSIGPFTLDVGTPPRVFDVTDPLQPIEILGGTYAGGTLSFRRVESGARRYRVIPETQIQLVTSGVFMAPVSSLNNLRAKPDPLRDGADFLIIYYDGFKTAADTLAAWRQARLPLYGTVGPYETATVPISAVYDQFSGGRADPGAVRNFLRSAFYNWARPPSFVTLLGDASYDFKNIFGFAPTGLPGTLLPSYEGGYDVIVQRQFATDDWMLNVDNPTTVIPDFFGGRIPAGDAASALTFVRDKLLPYERNAPFGEWRNRVMLVADDHEQGSRVDNLRWEHVRQTAVLDRRELPPHFDRAYVYLHTYPDGPNDTKPAAKADILDNLNGEGVIMWNYIGHGSPFKIADESVFLVSDAGTLTNFTKPAVFVAASCDVGKFHDPRDESIGERLVMDSGGGCIAVVSATELAFSFQNAELNRILYHSTFRRDSIPSAPPLPTYGRYHESIAEALLEAKTGSTNNQKYQLMGDSGTRPDLPFLTVEITLKDANGVPIDTLRRGDLVTFDGRVLDRPAGVLMPFNGAVSVLIQDSAPIDTTFACQFCNRENYPFRASPMFRGDARVLNGAFTGRFVVPLDAVLGPRGR